MKDANTNHPQALRSIALIAGATALGMAFTVAPLQAAHGHKNDPPPVPAAIEGPAQNESFLVGHAIGTQNYVCLPAATPAGVAWTLFTPQATLFKKGGRQLQAHFFSPNPIEAGTVRATWRDSRDTSTVWGVGIASSSDPSFVAPGAIPWLLIQVVGTEEGPTGGDNLTETTYIQRLNTTGGVAPATGCALPADIGKRAFVPYTADYYFFEHEGCEDHDDE